MLVFPRLSIDLKQHRLPKVALLAQVLSLAAGPAMAQSGITITTNNPPSNSGPMIYQGIQINNSLQSTATGLTNGMSNGSVRGLYVEMDDTSSGGSNSQLVTPFTSHIVVTGSAGGDKVGGIFNSYNSGTISGGYNLGGDSTATADQGSSQPVLAAHQFEVTSLCNSEGTNCASIGTRMGIEITIDPDSAVHGSSFDAAIAIDDIGAPNAKWKNGISFGSSTGTAVPLDTDASVIHANSTMTIANFCDCGGFDVTGYIMNFPNFNVTGAGQIVGTGYSFKGSGGIANGASCPAGTFSAATAVIQGGIITHC